MIPCCIELSPGTHQYQCREELTSFKMGKGKLRQCMASFTCQLMSMVASAAYCWFEPLTIRLAEDPELNLTTEDVSWLMAIVMVGAGISPLVSGYLTNRIGRKLLIMSIGPLCLTGWIIVLCSKSMVSLAVVRVLHGLATGVAFTIPPIYVAEIVEPNLRGRLSGTFLTTCYLGTMYSFCIGPFLTYNYFALACLPFPLIFSIIWMFMPETPYYLLMNKREDEAKNVLRYFRDGGVEAEFEDMQKAVLKEISTQGSWKTLFCDKVERNAFIIVQIVSIAKNLTGIVVIENYALDTFSRSESFLPAEGMSILIAAFLTGITVIAAFLSDSVGRKPLLLLSCFGCFVSNFLTGGYYYIHENTTVDASNFAWALYIGLFMYCMFSDIGVGPILQTLQSEMFRANTRGIASGTTEALGSLLSLVLIKYYSPITETYGVYLNFWLYSLVGLICGVLLSCLMYETAGKTIGQMEDQKEKSYCLRMQVRVK